MYPDLHRVQLCILFMEIEALMTYRPSQRYSSVPSISEWEAMHGSCAVKSHVLADDIWKLEALFALNELKEEHKGKLTYLF